MLKSFIFLTQIIRGGHLKLTGLLIMMGGAKPIKMLAFNLHVCNFILSSQNTYIKSILKFQNEC